METTFSPSFATHNCPRSVHKVHVCRLLFPHRELHTIVLDQYTKVHVWRPLFAIVHYILFYTLIFLDQYTNSMNGDYFLPILRYIPFS
jgi:hypothetical protein